MRKHNFLLTILPLFFLIAPASATPSYRWQQELRNADGQEAYAETFSFHARDGLKTLRLELAGCKIGNSRCIWEGDVRVRLGIALDRLKARKVARQGESACVISHSAYQEEPQLVYSRGCNLPKELDYRIFEQYFRK